MTVTYYVDGIAGADRFDGLAAVAGDHGPKATIQAALSAAAEVPSEDYVEIVVLPGSYPESIRLPRRPVVLTSFAPEDPNVVAATRITGAPVSPAPVAAVLFNGTGHDESILRGFTVNTGNGRAVECRDGAAPTLVANVITGNPAGAILCIDSSPRIIGTLIFRNGPIADSAAVRCVRSTAILLGCTLADNEGAAAVFSLDGSPVLRNCIVWGTTTVAGEPGAAVWCDGGGAAVVTYSCLQGGRNGLHGQVYAGRGVMDSDPLFAAPAAGDFHLRSQAGRWAADRWVLDADTSPCIDAGDPADTVTAEPPPSGGRLNLGAFGNTPRASRSPGNQPPSHKATPRSRSLPAFSATLLRAAGHLVAGWPLVEDFGDVCPRALHLQPEGDIHIRSDVCRLEQAGWADLVSVPTDLGRTASGAISLWFSSVSGGTLLSTWDRSLNRLSMAMAIDDTGTLTAKVWGRAVRRRRGRLRLTGPAAGSGWHHVLLSWRPGTTTLFVDGMQCTENATQDSALLRIAGIDKIRLGAEQGGREWDSTFGGDIANVLWFADWLGAAEARELFSVGAAMSLAQLLATDVDGDGLSDCWEEAWLDSRDLDGTDDPDGDGLSNEEEETYGCDPRRPDTDGDGLTDGDEVHTHRTDPLNPDTDGDGLSDGEEVLTIGSNPHRADSDGDGLTDGWEVSRGLSPLRPDSDGDGTLDGDEDTDRDGLTNAEEQSRNTDPAVPDVGRATVTFSTRMTRVDETAGTIDIILTLSDLPDFRGTAVVSVECVGGTAQVGTDVLFDRQTVTFTHERLTAAVAVNILSDTDMESTESLVLSLVDPEGATLGAISRHTIEIDNALTTAADTDGDGMPDAWEIRYLGSLDQAADGDFDGDGMVNLKEYRIGTRPDKPFRVGTPGELRLRVTGVTR